MWWLVFFFNLTLNSFLFLYFTYRKSFLSPLIFLHLCSLIFLFLSLINFRKIKLPDKKQLLDLIIITCLFSGVLLLYLYKIEVITPGIWGDEITVGRMAEKLLSLKEFTPFLFINYGHPTPLLYLTGLVIKIFGRSITSIRLISVLFGAANVVVIYLLFRLFFNRIISFAGAMLLMFSYVHIIISRFGYEMTAGIFFQISALIFLFLAKNKKSNVYYILFGGMLGLGLFSYLAFRTIAFFLIVISFFYLNDFSSFHDRLLKYFLIIGSIFMITVTLSSYSFNHPNQIWARTKSISLFHQGLPREEAKKELLGNLERTFGMFIFVGDPNPRQNPSGTTPFDVLTVLGALFGFIVLFKNKKELFYIFFLLFLANIINDIFTIERIPEFHYYGLGHPNTLRISGILPMIYFSFTYGLNSIYPFLKKIIFIPILIIIFINFSWYFFQPISNFNYEVNGVKILKIVNFINQSKEKLIYVSPTLMTDDRFDYFVNKQIVLKKFDPKEKIFSLNYLPKNKLVIFDPKINKDLAINLLKRKNEFSLQMNLQTILDPWSRVETIIIFPQTF